MQNIEKIKEAQKKDLEKEFDDIWEHWIWLSGIKRSVNFGAFKSGIKSYVLHKIKDSG